jgi:mono/diheme cytochrome c family protein
MSRVGVLVGILGITGVVTASDALGQARPDSVMAAPILALGDSIFHGKKAGGMCFTCHGANARGTPGLAPNLTDGKWLHGDGSYDFIVGVVEKGIPKPKEAVAPMLPRGGANLNAAQIRAVAAYVYTLSHK